METVFTACTVNCWYWLCGPCHGLVLRDVYFLDVHVQQDNGA